MEQTTVIMKETCIYGYLIVDNHNVIHQYILDKQSKGYKAPFNQVGHYRSVATPKDTAIVSMNIDTPYSLAWLLLGIYGNASKEYLGVGYQADSERKPFSGNYEYQIKFKAGALPSVGAFWSITAWLPVSQDAFNPELRTFEPGEAIIDGTW